VLTAILFCVPAGTESAAKQTGNEQQIAENHRTEAAVKTPFPHIFAMDFFCCDLKANHFITHPPFLSF
jgi:hypothetical protein